MIRTLGAHQVQPHAQRQIQCQIRLQRPSSSWAPKIFKKYTESFCAQEAWAFYYYYFNLLECASLQFMTIALFTVLKRVCLIYEVHGVNERLQFLLAHQMPCSLLLLDSLTFACLSHTDVTGYSKEIFQSNKPNNHHFPHSWPPSPLLPDPRPSPGAPHTQRHKGSTWRPLKSLAEFRWFPLLSPHLQRQPL